MEADNVWDLRDAGCGGDRILLVSPGDAQTASCVARVGAGRCRCCGTPHPLPLLHLSVSAVSRRLYEAEEQVDGTLES